MLLLAYSVVIPPLIVCALSRDVKAKGDGFMIWHLDSVGILLQRFCFSILVFTCIIIFEVCDSDNNDTAACVSHSLIPMLVPLTCVTCKVVCLKQ